MILTEKKLISILQEHSYDLKELNAIKDVYMELFGDSCEMYASKTSHKYGLFMGDISSSVIKIMEEYRKMMDEKENKFEEKNPL